MPLAADGGDPMGSLIQESWIFFILPHESRCTHYSYKCLVLLWVSHHMISYQTMGYDRSWESLLAQLLILASAQAIFAFDHLHHIFIIAISSPGLMSNTSSGQPLLAIRISAASINVTVNLRKPTMKLLIFILTITTFPLVSTATSMESLLRAQIMAARCEARCNMEENNLERREAMQCREVCSLLLSTSSTTSSSSSFSLFLFLPADRKKTESPTPACPESREKCQSYLNRSRAFPVTQNTVFTPLHLSCFLNICMYIVCCAISLVIAVKEKRGWNKMFLNTWHGNSGFMSSSPYYVLLRFYNQRKQQCLNIAKGTIDPRH